MSPNEYLWIFTNSLSKIPDRPIHEYLRILKPPVRNSRSMAVMAVRDHQSVCLHIAFCYFCALVSFAYKRCYTILQFPTDRLLTCSLALPRSAHIELSELDWRTVWQIILINNNLSSGLLHSIFQSINEMLYTVNTSQCPYTTMLNLLDPFYTNLININV